MGMAGGGERDLTVYYFSSYRFETESLQLKKAGSVVKIRPKSAEVLRYLLENRHQTVTKKELLDTFWQGEHVSENTLFQVIREIRNILADEKEPTPYIMTFPKKGYQWVYQGTRIETAPEVAIQPPSVVVQPQPSRKRRPIPAKAKWFGGLGLALVGFALLVAFWLGPPNGYSEPVKPIGETFKAAVFDFKNLSAQPQWDWMATALAEGLRADLNGQPGLYALSGDLTQQIQADLTLPSGEPFNETQLTQIRRYNPCRFIIVGSFLMLDQTVRVHWYVKDEHTSEWQSGNFLGNQQDIPALLAGTGAAILGAMGLTAAPNQQEAETLPTQGESLRYFAEGLRHLRLMDAKSASAFFEKSLAEDPQALSTHLRSSQAYALLGDRKRAEQMASQAIRFAKNGKRRDQLLAQANLLEIQQQWRGAAGPFQALWLLEPGNVDLGVRATQIQIEAGDVETASQNMATLRALDMPQDPRLDLLAAKIAGIKGEYALQLRFAQTATRNAEALGARSLVARGFLTQSQAQHLAGDNPEALVTAEKAATLFRELGQFSGYSQARMAMGDIHNVRGAIPEALPYYQEAMEHFENLGDRAGVAQVELQLGRIHLRQRKYAEAAPMIASAIARFRESGSHDLAAALSTYGLAHINLGQYDQAIEAYDESNFLYRKVGELYPIAENNSKKAIIYARQGQIHDAIRLFDKAAALAKETEQTTTLGTTLHNLGQLTMKTGQLARAGHYFDESIAMEIENHRPIRLAASYYRRAQLLFQKGQYDQAMAGFKAAQKTYLSLDRVFDSYNLALGLGEVHLVKKNFAEAQAIAALGFEELVEADNVFYIQNLLFQSRLCLAQEDHAQALDWVNQALSPQRSGRQSYQALSGQYLKATILTALGRLDEAAQAIDEAESLREKAKNVFSDMEKALVEARVNMKRGERDVAVLQLNRLVDQAEEMGALHMFERIKAELAHAKSWQDAAKIQR